MFFKSSGKDKKRPAKSRFHIDYDNLAVPEIRTGTVRPEPEKPPADTSGYTVDYDNLAVPEVNPPHRRRQ